MQVVANGVETGAAIFDAENKTFSLDLKGAYPEDSEIDIYKRVATLGKGRVTVTDTVKSKIDGEIQFNYLLTTEPVFVEDGIFTVNGVKVEYDRSLSFSYDCPDVTMPETVDMPVEWECERLYRIKLTALLKADEEKSFKIEVRQQIKT